MKLFLKYEFACTVPISPAFGAFLWLEGAKKASDGWPIAVCSCLLNVIGSGHKFLILTL